MRLFVCCILVVAVSLFASVASADLRTWTSAGGGFKIEASIVGVETAADGDKIVFTVVLERAKSGKEIRVPLLKLSAPDQEYVRQRMRKARPEAGSLGTPKLPSVPGTGSSATTTKPKPKPKPKVAFKPGDGKDKATEFLADQGLEAVEGVWSLASEEDALKEWYETANDANTDFNRARGKVIKNQRKAAKVNVLEKDLQRKIKILENEILNGFFNSNRKERAALAKLKQRMANEVKPFREREDADKQEVFPVHKDLEDALRETEDKFALVEDRYKELRSDSATQNALKELEQELTPSKQYQRWQKKLAKMRTNVRENAPR